MERLPFNISICSIVRDCESILKKNIPEIENLRKHFEKSEVIIFENDSKDGTKKVLKDWGSSTQNTFIFCDDFNIQTIPSKSIVNKYFSQDRISKMSRFRNQYMNILNSQNTNRDYVIVIDLDIEGFELQDILDCFRIKREWHCITAYGTSLGSNLRRQYHDTYALCEIGMLHTPQTEKQIRENRRKFSRIRSDSPLIPVHSAFGGMAIYKWEAIAGLQYEVLPNDDEMVEVRCEHFGLHKQMINRDFNLIYINPCLRLQYRTVDSSLIIKYIKERFQKG
jgi:hypothetical protein